MRASVTTPWQDHAVLIRSGSVALDREVISEGQLSDIVLEIMQIEAAARDRLMIALPDRHTAPFCFEEPQFASLILEHLSSTWSMSFRENVASAPIRQYRVDHG